MSLISGRWSWDSKFESTYRPALLEKHVLEAEAVLHEEEVHELDLAIDALRAQQTILRNLATRKRSVCAPIRKLSPELLGLIFVHCRDLELEWGWYMGGYRVGPRSCPILCTRVCQHWRNVAEKTPSLWTYIYVDQATLNLHGFRGWFLQFLQFSGSLPLDVVISTDMDYNPKLSFPHSMICPMFSRCRTFYIAIGEHDTASQDILFPNTEKSMPLLETFHAYVSNDIGVIDAPLLNSFAIEADGKAFIDPSKVISLSSSLTTLEVRYASMSAPDATKIIGSFPNLIRCRLHDITWTGGMDTTTFTAPKLQFLSISWSNEIDSHLVPIIRRVELPSLETLKLKMINRRGYSHVPLDEFITSSGWSDVMQNVRHLKLYHMNLDYCDFGSQVLPLCHSLETLDLKCCNGTVDVISCLESREESERDEGKFRFCPRLEVLTMTMGVWEQQLTNLMNNRKKYGCLRTGIFHQPGKASIPVEKLDWFVDENSEFQVSRKFV